MKKNIDEMFAFIVNGDKGEGIIGAKTFDPDGSATWMPLVGADMDRCNSYKSIAQGVADEFGMEVKLIKFSTRTELETLVPKVKNEKTTK